MLNLYCVYCIVNSFVLNENHGAVIVNFLEHQLSSLFLLCVINNEAVIVNPMNESEFGLKLLYQLFREVVLYVGVENIVHMVNDNAANYVVAGRLLMEEFPSIFWSPCVAHCINLILQDIGKLQSVCCVVKHASGITKYIYNHCYPLYLMRKFTGGK